MDTLEISDIRLLARIPHKLTNEEMDALKRSRLNYFQKIAILEERKQELIRHLDQEISHFLDCANACQQALAPINHLPDDLLREIFLHLHLCVPHHSESSGFSLLHPIVISQVCRRWRTVAHDFAGVWTRLRTQRLMQKWDHRGLELLAQWLQRAKGMPLNLQLDARLEDGEEADDSGQLSVSRFVYQLIEPVSSSLTRLLLKYVNVEDLSPLSNLQFPCLEQFVLCLNFDSNPGPGFGVGLVNVPALRLVSFSGSLLGETDRSITFPWNQITHFLCYNGLDYCEFFLTTRARLCTQLRFLSFELYNEGMRNFDLDNFISSSSTRIVLPSLETLGLDLSNLYRNYLPDTNSYLDFLAALELPNLRKLILALHPTMKGISSAALDEIRRLKGLEHLSVSVLWRRDNTLMPILRACRHLTTLELSLPTEYTPFFEKMMEENLLPNLHTFVCVFDPENKFHNPPFLHPDIFVRFVESRTRPGLYTPLKKITFFVRGKYPTLKIVQEALSPFLFSGLDVEFEIKYATPSESTSGLITFDPGLQGRPELLELY